MAPGTGSDPAVIPTRSITPKNIDADALKVVRRLQRFGHPAYLVGGCVRDLLLKRAPKDFDVATSARPNEIRKLFRNCRLIGRRFRLAHIHFRGKVIETATFRAVLDEQREGDLLIRSDNVFGTEEEDARRRDFTINALFYDPVQRVLIDYVGGLEDLVERAVRFIGPAGIRVREDPVRILRAIKFAARLGFQIEPGAWRAMIRYRQDLTKCARPRILEEIYRMLRGGGAEASFRLMWEAGVLHILLPELAEYLSRAPERGEERDPGAGLWSYLKVIDGQDRELLTNAVLIAAVLIHPVLEESQRRGQMKKRRSRGTVAEAAQDMLRGIVERINLPKREAERIQQLLASQRRLFNLHRNAALPKGLIRRAYFPEALDLFEIGVRATGRGRRTLNRLRQAFRRPPRKPSRRNRSRRRERR
jgi:poly(A) polymerase